MTSTRVCGGSCKAETTKMEAGLIKGEPRTEMERIIKGEQGRRSSAGPIDKKEQEQEQ